MARLYYIVQSEMMTGGVIEAQVIGTLRAHSRIEGQPKTKLIFLEPARVALGKRARATLRKYRSLWPEGDIAIVPYVSRLGETSAGKSLALYLLRERMSREEIIFHCRGPATTWAAHIARESLSKGRVIFDVRGPFADETIHRLGFPWPSDLSPEAERAHHLCMDMDRRAAAVADRVFTLSPGMKRYAIEKFGASEERTLVVPSCVENLSFNRETRDRVRREWGANSSSPVFLYAGRLGRERLPRHMFRLFAAVLRLRPDAKFILMTYLNQLADIESLIKEAGMSESSVTVVSHSRDEALLRMCAADVGLLFLEPALRYQDCFPIKIPEYLSAGLSLAMNSSVGNLPDLVSSRRLGWVIDEDASDELLDENAQKMVGEMEGNSAAMRKRSLDACSELFLWRNHVPAIRRAYGLEDYQGEKANQPIIAAS
ncbi:MAG: glycosyltransferase [Acidobacteriota bacterium]